MLIPVNKYLVVEPIREQKSQDVTILIPESVNIDSSRYSVVRIIKSHASSHLEEGTRLLVPTHMIEEASVFGETYHIILENHVIGFLSEVS